MLLISLSLCCARVLVNYSDPGCAHPWLRGVVSHRLPAAAAALCCQGDRQEAAQPAGPVEACLSGRQSQEPHQVRLYERTREVLLLLKLPSLNGL